MQDFRKLRVWATSHQLAIDIFHVTKAFPPAERYGMTAQMRRASSSVPANIAEGCGRGTAADMRRCLLIALGSSCELLEHCMLARDIGLMDAATYEALEAKGLPARRMLLALIKRLSPPSTRAPEARAENARRSRAEHARPQPRREPQSRTAS